ncbi:hypothetical protein CORC01_02278 [Colletotrichum orchidophilum]|uniref:Uncharacterized protein n=1 Tax=Colletotrichum orchidophilum TaxID=1209926 RepID=A0A1G4BLS7_9PEZI|nr:uncharacterized protein CORC01_02278 [Colletotrichum orchidophilum]OHF02285.1 hypothetical protein CORC01_02278 [Colletotrichum orchidophilum]
MHSFTVIATALISTATADFTSYCCAFGAPEMTTGDIAWALADPHIITELGVAGNTPYTHWVGTCKYHGKPMPCGKYTTTARTRDRPGKQLASGYLECDDVSYLEFNDQWSCPF